ncbi:Serine/threonine protein [Salix suchowensis]|nr:Serine/threonine protein [Salix suchowensis]
MAASSTDCASSSPVPQSHQPCLVFNSYHITCRTHLPSSSFHSSCRPQSIVLTLQHQIALHKYYQDPLAVQQYLLQVAGATVPGGYRTTCVDRSSTFFRSLTAPLASSQHSEPWHEPFLDPSSDYSRDSTRVDLPWTEEGDPSVTARDECEPVAGPDLPRGYWPSILPKSIYTPHGKWAWAEGKPIDDPKEEAFLSRFGLVPNKRQRLLHRGAVFVPLFSFCTHPLLVACPVQVPTKATAGVRRTLNNRRSFICNEHRRSHRTPHPSFWMEASSDMPNVLKQRCIAAIQRIHDQGVLHGDIQLRHMLIGGNAKVSIVDFDGSRAILPNEAVKVGKASAEDLDKEMKRAMVLLKYGDAPDAESVPVVDSPIHEGAGPRRFVMPGQTPAQLQDAIQRFLFLVDGLAEAGSPLDEPTESRLPPDTDGPKGDTVPHSPPALRERSPEPPPPFNHIKTTYPRKNEAFARTTCGNERAPQSVLRHHLRLNVPVVGLPHALILIPELRRKKQGTVCPSAKYPQIQTRRCQPSESAIVTQLILDSHDDVVDSGAPPITQSAVAIGKRKRDEALDCPVLKIARVEPTRSLNGLRHRRRTIRALQDRGGSEVS